MQIDERQTRMLKAGVFHKWLESLKWAVKATGVLAALVALTPITLVGWCIGIIVASIRAGMRMADDTIDWLKGLSLES